MLLVLQRLCKPSPCVCDQQSGKNIISLSITLLQNSYEVISRLTCYYSVADVYTINLDYCAHYNWQERVHVFTPPTPLSLQLQLMQWILYWQPLDQSPNFSLLAKQRLVKIMGLTWQIWDVESPISYYNGVAQQIFSFCVTFILLLLYLLLL